MFQSYCPIDGRTFRSLHPNVVYIPMFDQFGLSQGPPTDLSAFWRPFRGSKVLSFSAPVHMLASGFGVASHFVRYFPEIPTSPPRRAEGLFGFVWLRRQREVNWDVVRALIGDTQFDAVHLHLVGDPGFPPVQPPPPEDVETYNITTSTWFQRRSDLDEVVTNANVYFAPRGAEGIGQTFLEALARGQCVVATDQPTMSEYIVHGVNGLLYDLRSPAPLDFSEVSQLGGEARRGMVAGRARWEESEELLVEFVLTPSKTLYGDHSRHRNFSDAVRFASDAVRTAARRAF
jgi:hypothetical protein